MSLRHCATQGCLGTLPARTGTHCPRCGGTEFLRQRRRGRGVVLIVLIALAIGVASLVSKSRRATFIPPERRALVEARDVAARMTVATTRDEAFADIIHRALAKHDFEYACQLGGEMTIATNKDQCLLETVEAALKAHQPAWATRAADEIVIATNRDDALRKIMDSASHK